VFRSADDVPATVLKTATYGLTHLVVAMAVAFALTGSWRIALAIGLVEPFAQTLAYAVHERLWAGRDRRAAAEAGARGACACAYVRLGPIGRPAFDRATIKTATYAVMHLCVAVLVAFALTGSWAQALAIGLVEPVVQTFAFVFHERAWARRDRRTAWRREAEA
jgi:uncharacterized membrane protein